MARISNQWSCGTFSELLRNKQMEGISYRRTWSSVKRHTHRSITVSEAFGSTPFEDARVSELEFSSQKSVGERECNSNVVRWTMWRKKVIGTLVMPSRERVFRMDESMIFESASSISLLKEFQSQYSDFQFQCQPIRHKIIEKRSRPQNGSRRMASSDVPFIDLGCCMEASICIRVMLLTKDWMTGFWTRSWWIPWQISSLLRVILENRRLRLGRRNEEETRLHCLSKSVSSSTAAITLSMMSCGMSIDFAICAKMAWR